MGKRLKRPVTTKKNFHGENQALRYAGSCMQGWRPTMEDSHKVCLSLPNPMNNWAFAGVFDGHGGAKVSKYIARCLMRKIVKSIPRDAITNNNEQDIKKGIKAGFLKIDQEMRTNKKINDNSGSTAVCVLVSPTHYYFINCGDSRAVLCRQEKVRFATRDHKPTLKREEKRIKAAGGDVWSQRVEGRLALSRALGDFEFKQNAKKGQTAQMVSPQPDIKVIERNNQTDHFIVLACDGIYDVMSNPQLIRLIEKHMGYTENLTQVCKKVVDHCLENGSRDNMSIVILKLPGCPSQNQIQAKQKLNLAQMHVAIRAKKRKAPTGGNPPNGSNAPNETKNAAPGGNAANNVAPGGNAANNAAPRENAANNVVSGENAANNTAPEENAVTNAAPGGNAVNDVVPNITGETASQNPTPVVQKQVAAATVGVLRKPNPFLVYFVQYWKKHGGNVCRIAKHCGVRWNQNKEKIQKSQLVRKTITKKGKSGKRDLRPRKVISNAKAQLIKQTIKKGKK